MLEVLPNWHPIFVHFTVALTTVSLILFCCSIALTHYEHEHKHLLRILSYGNLWLAGIFTVFTALSGWYAFNTVAHDTPSHMAMTIHRNWAIAAVVLIVLGAIWSYQYISTGHEHHKKMMVVLLVGIAVILPVTAWKGGEVVYRYGLGVISIPQVDNHGHDHVHSKSDPEGETHDATSEHEPEQPSGSEKTIPETKHDDDHQHN